MHKKTSKKNSKNSKNIELHKSHQAEPLIDFDYRAIQMENELI